jgi:hypothetical protein
MPMDPIHSLSGQSARESRTDKDAGIARLFQLQGAQSIALAVLVIGIGIIELFALIIRRR